MSAPSSADCARSRGAAKYARESHERTYKRPGHWIGAPMNCTSGAGAHEVLAHLDAQEARVPEVLREVEQLRERAEAVASEHGHALGPWYASEHLITAAICQGCGVGVALRDDGHGSNADPLRWLREQVCERDRFYVVKSGRGHFVRDRERPAYGPRAMGSAAKCRRVARALNAELAPVEPIEVDALDKARQRVERARKALDKAQRDYAALGGEQGFSVALTHRCAPQDDVMPDPPRGRAAAIRTEVPMPKTNTPTKTTSKRKAPAKRTTSAIVAGPLPSGPKMAEQFLAELGRPAHIKVICDHVLALDAARPKASRCYHGKTPAATISAQLTLSHCKGSTFVRVEPGCFGLSAWPASKLKLKPTRADAAPAAPVKGTSAKDATLAQRKAASDDAADGRTYDDVDRANGEFVAVP